jgi:hypothetical protein
MIDSGSLVGREASIVDLATGTEALIHLENRPSAWPSSLELRDGDEYSVAIGGTGRVVRWRLAVIPARGDDTEALRALAAHDCTAQLIAMALRAPVRATIGPTKQ